MHAVEHGTGRPVLILHGGGVDHREPEACFEEAFRASSGWRRIYPDLPGAGATPAPGTVRSAADVVAVLLEFAAEVADGERPLLVGHSAGAYLARGMAARHPERFGGLALFCPLSPEARDIPVHRLVDGAGDLGDDGFRNYFVVQTPDMLARYEEVVAPAAALIDEAAMARIGARWELALDDAPTFAAPTLIVAGRRDSTVGFRAALDLGDVYPSSTVAVVDDAGHALPHERPDVVAALMADWLERVERAGSSRS